MRSPKNTITAAFNAVESSWNVLHPVLNSSKSKVSMVRLVFAKREKMKLMPLMTAGASGSSFGRTSPGSPNSPPSSSDTCRARPPARPARLHPKLTQFPSMPAQQWIPNLATKRAMKRRTTGSEYRLRRNLPVSPSNRLAGVITRWRISQ